MATFTRFEDIEAWQLARRLTADIYTITRRKEFARDYALRDQIRRAANSIMSNVAEGYESRTHPLFIDLLGRAKGSSGEVRSQLYVAFDAGYINDAEFNALKTAAEYCSGKIQRLADYLRSLPGSA
jgi:four helix bundle protein